MYIQPLFRQLVAAARTRLANPPPVNPLPASSTPPHELTGLSFHVYVTLHAAPLCSVSIKYLPFDEYANIIIYAQFRRFYASCATLVSVAYRRSGYLKYNPAVYSFHLFNLRYIIKVF